MEDRGVFVGGYVPLRPMTVGDVLDGAWKLTRAIVKPFLLLSLVLGVPLAVAGAPSPLSGGATGFDATAFEDLAIDGALLGLVGVALLLQGFVITPMQYTAAAWLMSEAELGREHTWTEAVGHAFRRFPRALGSTILVVLALVALSVPAVVVVAVLGAGLDAFDGGGVAFAIVVVPLAIIGFAGIFMLLALGYTWGLGAVAAQNVEGLTTGRSVGRMWRLIRTRPLGIVWTGFVAGIVVSILSGILSGIAALPLALGPELFAVRVLSGVIQTAVSALVVPFTMAVGLLLYVDARIRSEGFDLQVRAAGRG